MLFIVYSYTIFFAADLIHGLYNEMCIRDRDYADGWYEKVEAMQGKDNTFYAGEVLSLIHILSAGYTADRGRTRYLTCVIAVFEFACAPMLTAYAAYVACCTCLLYTSDVYKRQR